MFKSLLILIFSSTFLTLVNAQEDSISVNLIPNPGFEQANRCVKYDELCCPEAWRSTTPKLFYYLNDMNSNRAKQIPAEGHRMISMCLHDASVPKNRAFAQVPLLCPLMKGETYQLSFSYKATNAHLGQFGVLFRERIKVSPNNAEYLGLKPDIAIVLPDSLREDVWIRVEQTYTAKGDEQVMIIGNFTAEDSINIQPFVTEVKQNKRWKLKKKKESTPLKSRTYYMFDQFELRSVNSNIRCDDEARKQRIFEDDVRHSIPQFDPLRPPRE